MNCHIYAPSKNRTQPTLKMHLACCYTCRVQMSECVNHSRKCSFWQQVHVLSYNFYQYKVAKYNKSAIHLANDIRTVKHDPRERSVGRHSFCPPVCPSDN